MNTYGQFKDYGFQIVDKRNNNPVRSGEKSLRFEIRGGDCYASKNWNDCEKKRERHELDGVKKLFKKGEWWYAWSIFFPKDFIEVAPVRVYMGQFHSKDKKYGDERNPPWMFFNTSRENIGGYWINNMVRVPAGYSTQLLTREEAYGKWNDILINVKWTNKEDGFMKIWVNDKIKLVSGPVAFHRKGGVFHKQQALEFSSLIGSGAGSIGTNNAIFCIQLMVSSSVKDTYKIEWFPGVIIYSMKSTIRYKYYISCLYFKLFII